MSKYETVIGLEVHIELKTKTKIFCSCPVEFGAQPNTNTCPVCMGMPGTLPVLNREVVNYAVKAGMALNCDIARFSKLDRKNYFYPDLPKAYQISQYDLPLCEHGWLDIETPERGKSRIGITRIHIEEDAGKLVHTNGYQSGVDCNRCGVPLIEIVSEPDIRSAQEAVAYLQKLRSIVLYTGVSDCKMNEGSMRCDVNISIRKAGSTEFGTRTEIKNLNSFNFVQKAIIAETERQIDVIESGGEIVQETRRYDPDYDETLSMRKKENANDYRYFPDPDLIPIVLSEERLEELRAQIPEMPQQRFERYVSEFKINENSANQLVSEKAVADFFECGAKECKSYQTLANIILSEIVASEDCEQRLEIDPKNIAKIADCCAEGKINSNAASKIIPKLCEDLTLDTMTVIEKLGLIQISDSSELEAIVDEVIAANEKSVNDYKNGKTAALQALIGQVMKRTKGRANPKITAELLTKKLV